MVKKVITNLGSSEVIVWTPLDYLPRMGGSEN